MVVSSGATTGATPAIRRRELWLNPTLVYWLGRSSRPALSRNERGISVGVRIERVRSLRKMAVRRVPLSVESSLAV